MKRSLWLRVAGILRDRHVSDDELSRLLFADLSPTRAARAREHLLGCRKCSLRYRSLEAARLNVLEYRAALPIPSEDESQRWRRIFVDRVDELLSGQPRLSWGARFHAAFQRSGVLLAKPLLLGALIPAAIIALLSWRGSPPVTASELLHRAVLEDRELARSSSPGVIRQRLHIHAAGGVEIEEVVWRDAKRLRLRKPKTQSNSASEGVLREPGLFQQEQEEALWKKLEAAGIAPEDPLSAKDYQAWRDRQISLNNATLNNTALNDIALSSVALHGAINDDVARASGGMLRLTTNLGNSAGAIEQETISLREADLHVVERTVRFRDIGEVDLAEVNYQVVPWNAETEALFEAEAPPTPDVAAPRVAPLRPLSKSELDEAELDARLILNRLNADSGEQIELARTPTGIRIRGVVATGQRKQEIASGLRSLRNIASSISSLDELNAEEVQQAPRAPAAPSTTASTSRISERSVEARSSPLEKYFAENAGGKSNGDLALISQHLFDRALTIERESKALTDLHERFEPGEGLGQPGRDALAELLARHVARLAAGLDEEAKTIAELGINAPDAASTSEAKSNAGLSLKELAERNSSLCEELISGKEGAARSAPAILAELSDVMAGLRRRANAAESSAVREPLK